MTTRNYRDSLSVPKRCRPSCRSRRTDPNDEVVRFENAADCAPTKVEDYVEAARAMGNLRWRITLFHILPNIMPAVRGGSLRNGIRGESPHPPRFARHPLPQARDREEKPPLPDHHLPHH